MSADLVAFLRARLDEEAARATAATPSPWTWTPEEDVWNQCGPSLVGGGNALVLEPWGHDAWGMNVSPADQEHITTWQPARVLVEVDAKRRILAEHDTHSWRMGDPVRDCQWQAWPCTTLRLLALPFADHPDYREEWRP